MEIDESTLSKAELQIYREARRLLGQNTDAVTFSARFFGPQGELTRLGQGREERRRILCSELYRWLKASYTTLRQRDSAQFEKDLKSASGRLTVVVPKSLHAALKSEAGSEGVSLSELIRLKLGIPYRHMTELLTVHR